MLVLNFITDICKKFPWMLFRTTMLLLIVGFTQAVSLLSISPLVDFLIHADSRNLSPLTLKILHILSFFGLSPGLKNLVLIFFIFLTMSCLFDIFSRNSILKMKYAVIREMTFGTFEDFFNARWYFFTTEKQGKFMNTFSRELANVGDAFGALSFLFSGGIQLFFCLGVPLYISWQVTCISLFLSVIFVIPLVMLGKISYRWGRESTSTANRLSTVAFECFSLIKVILGFGNQKISIRKLSKAWDEHCRASIRSQTLGYAIPVMYRPFGVLMMIIALFLAQRFGVPISELTVLLMALLQIALSIGEMARFKNSLENLLPSYEQLKTLRKRAVDMKQVTGHKIFEGFKDKIILDNLSFAYPNHRQVLKDVSLVIPKGQMVALVGKSGAGKSTLIDMILGFHEPSGGSIKIDGISLTEFDINSYRQRIGYVPQDSVLFNMSIKENLLWSNPKATEEEIQSVCHTAYVDEFVSHFPDGYATIVGDRGVRLSGGQVQRVALARALLRRPVILVLDEATSSLDTHSERLIQQAIENVSKETTVIVVAHRLSTIKLANCIYVFDKGHVVEEGSYAQLVACGGHFSRMAQLQELEAAVSTKGES